MGGEVAHEILIGAIRGSGAKAEPPARSIGELADEETPRRPDRHRARPVASNGDEDPALVDRNVVPACGDELARAPPRPNTKGDQRERGVSHRLMALCPRHR